MYNFTPRLRNPRKMYIFFLLSRHSTARGSGIRFVPVSPTKVKAPKSILFTEGTPEVEIKNTCLIQLTHHICIRRLKSISISVQCRNR